VNLRKDHYHTKIHDLILYCALNVPPVVVVVYDDDDDGVAFPHSDAIAKCRALRS
jgi:hypothetical protein